MLFALLQLDDNKRKLATLSGLYSEKNSLSMLGFTAVLIKKNPIQHWQFAKRSNRNPNDGKNKEKKTEQTRI